MTVEGSAAAERVSSRSESDRRQEELEHRLQATGKPREKQPVPVLVGPTGSGKTETGIHLGLRLNGEILSADSRQIYKYLNIGTAKPNRAQRLAVPHHLIDELTPDRDFNAGEFGERGREIIQEIISRHRLPIVVGGSGLYVQSLIDGFFEGPGADPDYRDALEARLARGEMPALIDELRGVDPVSAGRIDPTKPRRIVRALEVYHATGVPLSAHQSSRKIDVPFLPVLFGLLWERKTLYERIDQRCDQMLRNGLLDEVDELERRGYGVSLNALNTVGYKEAWAFRRGDIDLDEMRRLFKRNSRRYAKRQMTWFKRDTRIHWIPVGMQTTAEESAEAIIHIFRPYLQSWMSIGR